MFRNFGPAEIIVVLVVLILLFGAKRLPDAARSLGRSMRIFKSEVKEMKDKPEAQAGSNVAGRPAPTATPIASERADTPEARSDVAGQATPSSEPTDKRPA